MRGTGLSDAVDCKALQRGLIQEPIAIGECANQLGATYAGYTSAEGLPELRERLADRLARVNRVSTAPDRVLVTPGSSYALAAVMMAVCEPGDEVLLPEVFWPIYAQAAAVARVRVGTYPLEPGYRVDPDGAPGVYRSPVALTPEPAQPHGDRYADGVLTTDGRWIVCVRERHPVDGSEPVF